MPEVITQPIQVRIWHRTSLDYYIEETLGDFVWAYDYVLQDQPEEYQALSESEPHAGVFRINNAVDGWELNVMAKKRSLSVGDCVELSFFTDDDVLGYEAPEMFNKPIGTSKAMAHDLLYATRGGKTLIDGVAKTTVVWQCQPVGWVSLSYDEFRQGLPEGKQRDAEPGSLEAIGWPEA